MAAFSRRFKPNLTNLSAEALLTHATLQALRTHRSPHSVPPIAATLAGTAP
jgi:hypothetical protein